MNIRRLEPPLVPSASVSLAALIPADNEHVISLDAARRFKLERVTRTRF